MCKHFGSVNSIECNETAKILYLWSSFHWDGHNFFYVQIIQSNFIFHNLFCEKKNTSLIIRGDDSHRKRKPKKFL